jgi:hypothetical protein
LGKHRDWTEVEKDYQENGLSYSQLAKKYSIPIDTLKKAAVRQGWTKSKERRAKKAAQKVQNIQADVAEVQMVPNGTDQNGTDQNGTGEMAPVVPLYPDRVLPAESDAVRFERLVNQLMDRVEDAICHMDVTQAGSVKLMTGALKDLRDLKHLNKTALDIEEQKARIEKLRSETRIIEDDSEYGVILLPARDKVMPPE